MCNKYWVASNRSFPKVMASNPEELDKLFLSWHPERPQRIYFPFWSWKVPANILNEYDCIGFHSAPLPFGRGGSPIQNMIRLGHKTTEVCMFKMSKNYDEGDVLGRKEVLLTGTLADVIGRITNVIQDMIEDYERGISTFCSPMADYNNVPLKFERIVDNYLPEVNLIDEIYDEIRMRDEEGHPKAFLYHGKYRIDFTDAEIKNNRITAKVEIYEF